MTLQHLLSKLALTLPALCAIFSGCGRSEHAPELLANRSQGCLVNSDCSEPLVCGFQRCHEECVTTRDCDGKLRCVGAREQARVCQLEDEASCKTSADCATGFVCSSDGACRDRCSNDAECIGDQLCVSGVCAEPSELTDAGVLPQTLPLSTCRLNSDCSEGQQCISGACVDQCRDDRDCPANQRCQDGACHPAGTDCTGAECACQCRKDVDCAAGQTCDGCACQPGALPECQSSLDCADGERCVAGECGCACREDRDCPSAHTCDGCACVPVPPAARVLHDATVRDIFDLEQMRGVTEVQTTLTLTSSDLNTTAGLEALQTVGTLVIEYAGFTGEEDAPLGGLSGLREVRGDLILSNSTINRLSFDPSLRVGGQVTMIGTALTCVDIYVFEQNLRAQGWTGTITNSYSAGCHNVCVDGVCP